MKKNQKAVFLALLLIFFGIFLWSIWPSSIIEKNYQIGFKQPLYKESTCNPGLIFYALSFQIGYPEFLDRRELEIIQINLQKNWLENVNPPVNCTFQVEIYLDFSNSLVHPQNRILQKLSGDSSQSFQFEVEAKDKRKISGDLWIYLIAKSDQNFRVERTPILVVPVNVKPRSFLGVSQNIVSLISISIIFLLLVAIVYSRKPE